MLVPGIDTPYNELPLLPPDFNFDDVELLKMVNSANLALSELNGISKHLPNRLWLVSPLTVREAVASSGVENINTTIADVFEAELFPDANLSGPKKETLYYKDALLKGFEIVSSKGFLNSNGIIEIQKVLESNKSGIRRVTGTKIKSGFGGNAKTIYYPPEGYDIILEKLKNFEEYFNNFSNNYEIDPLIKIAILHYQFEAIHPFLDGNGRTGRILIVLYLVLAKRLDVPILFISDFILKNRSEYYAVLNGVTFKNDWKGLVLFILTAISYQALETQVTVLKIQAEMKNFEIKLREKNDKILNTDFINFLFSSPMSSYESASKALKIHKNTASKYLNQLVEYKLLERMKYKKEVVFINTEFLKILNNAT